MKRRGPLVPIPAGQLFSGRPDPAGTGQQGQKQGMEKRPEGRGWRQELAERLLGKLATRQGGGRGCAASYRMLPQAQEDPCRKAGAGSRQEAARTQEAFRASLATRLTAFWQTLPPWTRGALYTKRKALATNFLQVDNFLFEPISGTGRCLPSPRSPWPPATIWRSQHAALQQA